ncbi:hypothetical protein L227DRAFT_571202 [Lentinus tigrinus ALCF2SS1-6]|uniref:Uncharacterized protein n=1 Tax=Lentinus tigrinus ALCF2SS1-6 TaxID=1328759 RepID=A0A5C2SNQ8_9APHY|nr:hypothetical protein L227DRAFT_571202 [Lentinus tigrinus ALCF2SS1-6]
MASPPSEPALAQHPPAMKVGGRRLSMTSRPRPAPPSPEAQKATLPTADTPPDYPRPAAPANEGEQPPPHHQEEDVPKKKQGTGADEHERRLQESLYRKAEQNRPKKDFQSGPKTVGAGGRIGQPAGKAFGI